MLSPQSIVNADLPYVPWLTGYVAMLVGAVMTVLLQSSSVFTSTLTPLAGAGLVTLERAYPMTLGSNIGTTTTSLLASLTADTAHQKNAVQIALVHLLFNICGILMFYPVPLLRWPIGMARVLGRTTAKYRWFAVFYLLAMFFLFPAFVFGLSLLGPLALYCVLGPFFLALALVITVNAVQKSRPEVLPKALAGWDFLPLPLRSLEPYDRAVTALFGYCSCCPDDDDGGDRRRRDGAINTTEYRKIDMENSNLLYDPTQA